ncbi:Uncharacterized protein dnm_100300 [Desulfonema magnum]|uniref:Uncharacterized protein n=1 Tax=Desulfonema magnum TaxID=45655 RepID=A0A975BZP0_9BACT|nr:Uncharacterized protein dnm_100300 [Desulfonema magnum]
MDLILFIVIFSPFYRFFRYFSQESESGLYFWGKALISFPQVLRT